MSSCDRAWFVWTNGIKTADRFDDTLRFRTILVPHARQLLQLILHCRHSSTNDRFYTRSCPA